MAYFHQKEVYSYLQLSMITVPIETRTPVYDVCMSCGVEPSITFLFFSPFPTPSLITHISLKTLEFRIASSPMHP